MREIKFRAWDTLAEIMGKPHTIVEWMTMARTEGYRIYMSQTLMQYTGLKDKNGVEIYEGDKIRWGHMKNYYIVEYNPTLVCFQASNGTATGNFARKDCEVIGNIYENPELLGGENVDS